MMHLGLAHGHVFQFVALEYFAKWLHPEIFRNTNPINDLKEFYEIFMPYPLRGVWVVNLAEG
jgi:iron complex transport system substrate-binding protein